MLREVNHKILPAMDGICSHALNAHIPHSFNHPDTHKSGACALSHSTFCHFSTNFFKNSFCFSGVNPCLSMYENTSCFVIILGCTVCQNCVGAFCVYVCGI